MSGQVQQQPQPLQPPLQEAVGAPPNYDEGQRSECCYGVQDFVALRLIGRGGFGKVFQVQCVRSKRIFSMKVIDKRLVPKSRTDWSHVRSEHQVLTTNDTHPFIVRLFCTFQTRHKLYYVMEFLQGGELFSWLEFHSILSQDDAKFYLAEILLAFEYLHSKNIIFRDLKPENVMLDMSGHAKLIDFGLSKSNVDDNDHTTYTLCGTTCYMAPEVLLNTFGKKGYGLAADWWSFGALAFDMMAGTPPFQGSNRKKTLVNTLRCSLRCPTFFSRNSRLLVQALLEKVPEKRLGHESSGGASGVKKHPFFADNSYKNFWSDMYGRRIQPPIRPVIQSDTDLSHFDNMPKVPESQSKASKMLQLNSDSDANDDMDVDNDDDSDEAVDAIIVEENRPFFHNFSFVNPHFP